MAETSSYLNRGERFSRSFGAFTHLASLLEPVEFLQLQAVNRFLYDAGVSRVQMKWLLANNLHFFTPIESEAFHNKIFIYDRRLRKCLPTIKPEHGEIQVQF